jgi:transcriptional regulator with XRE-family HTH domain
MRGRPGRPNKPKGPRRVRGTPEASGVRRGVKERLLRLLENRGWTRQQLAEAAGVRQSALTGWFSEPSTIPSGASLYRLATTARVCPRWVLLGKRGIANRDIPREPWQSALRERISDELLQRGFSPLFLRRFLPSAYELAEMAVRDWMSRAATAEKLEKVQFRQEAVEKAIRHRCAAEDMLRFFESRDGDSGTQAPATAVRVWGPDTADPASSAP